MLPDRDGARLGLDLPPKLASPLMAHELQRLDAEKAQIVRELFIDTADDNYILARWCFVGGLSVDYSWLAVHTLEKYMKAALLLNGQSGKEGHDIRRLYKNVKHLSADLLPENLTQPPALEIDSWRDERPTRFLERLYRNGNAHNRYQIFGFLRHREDLFKLDSMAFALRRLCVPLEARRRPSKTNRTHRDVLTEEPTTWTVSQACRLERTVLGHRGEQLRKVLLNLNVSFAPEGFPHGSLRSSMAWHSSVIERLILRRLERSSCSDDTGRAVKLCRWMIENILLPDNVVQQLEEALDLNATSKPGSAPP